MSYIGKLNSGQVIGAGGAVDIGPSVAIASGALQLQIQSATVATAQATTNVGHSYTDYQDLATVGPVVTATVGASGKVLITLCSNISRNVGSGWNGYMAVAVSGATTLAAADSNAVMYSSAGGGFGACVSRTFVLSGLTPGSNTFTAKYRGSSTDAWTFTDRSITVIPL